MGENYSSVLTFIVEEDGIEFNGLTFANLPTVESVRKNRDDYNLNGFCKEDSTEVQRVENRKTSFEIIDDNDYSVGYDYCGIPSDLEQALSGCETTQISYKCSIGGLNGHMI